MTLDRRTFLAALGAAAGTAVLSGSSGPGDDGADAPVTVALWAQGAELAAFRSAARDFTAAEGVRVRLQPVPFDRLRATLDAALHRGRAPDVVRVPYTDVASYGSRGALLDLSGSLPAGSAGRFRSAPWRADAPMTRQAAAGTDSRRR